HRAGLQRFLASGQRRLDWGGVEFPGLHKSGREIHLEISFGRFDHQGQTLFTGIIRDVTARKRAERRLAAQYAAARALTEAKNVGDAAPGLLRDLCEGLGWDVGVLWAVDAVAGRLYCSQVWVRPGIQVPRFAHITREVTWLSGEDLPGRAWQSGQG